MGKISKYSNLYDKDGNFLHKPGNYSIEELEELIDTLDKNSKEFANATAILMHMYEQKGNHHRDELIHRSLFGLFYINNRVQISLDALQIHCHIKTGRYYETYRHLLFMVIWIII